MIRNLVWATGYNVVAIPLAAGRVGALGLFVPVYRRRADVGQHCDRRAERPTLAARATPTRHHHPHEMQTRHSTPTSHTQELSSRQSAHALAELAFSRAAGAPLVAGNRVQLLIDATQNYPAWLKAIAAARHHIHFESYIIHEDSAGLEFANALTAKAQEGVRVRLIYDWMGGFGKTSRKFWHRLRRAGVEVRCYNPPQLDSPLGWLSRDHRKMLAVDGEIGFISGLCVGRMWVGEPEKNIAPWRDTGVEVHGPALAELERAFADVWAMLGEPIPDDQLASSLPLFAAGDVSLRIVATLPATAGLFRLDQLVAAMARKRLWLTDAYYACTSAYVQALRAAALDGVDVRLLVPVPGWLALPQGRCFGIERGRIGPFLLP